MSATIKNEPIIIDDDDDYDCDKISSMKPPKDQSNEEIVIPDLYCALCLRQNTTKSKFYEYRNDDCTTFCEYVKDLLGIEYKLSQLFICMPCYRMVEMVDSFRQCCLKARGWIDRVGIELKCEDQWFAEGTLQAIEKIDETISSHAERLELAGNEFEAEVYINHEKVEQDVISIKSDCEDETILDMVNDEPEPLAFSYEIALEADDNEYLYYMDSPNLTDMDSSDLIEPVTNSAGTSQEQVKIKHTSDTPCKCAICGAILSNKTNLKEHLFIHGEATQQCKFCNKKFKQRTNLLRHHRTKHSDIPVRNLYPPPEIMLKE